MAHLHWYLQRVSLRGRWSRVERTLDDDVAFLRTVHELIHKEVDFYRRLWGNRWGWSRGTMNVFKALSSMPLCTEAKWGVRAECARLFLRSATVA